jgi:cytochrome P450
MPRDMLYRSTEPDHVPASLISSLSMSVEQHAAKRKIWNQAFTGPAVKEYDPYINNRSDAFIEGLGKEEGAFDLIKWLGYFTFVHCCMALVLLCD